MRKLQHPYPTSWDYFFNRREPAYVLIHLKNGSLIGGFYGENSYATAYPRQGSLYLETVIKVNEYGDFVSVIDESMGMLIDKDSYEYIEFFKLSGKEEEADETKP